MSACSLVIVIVTVSSIPQYLETEGHMQNIHVRISARIAFGRQTVQDAVMKILWLRTVNEDPVYMDSNDQATLDSTEGPCIEAREGEHSYDKTEAIRKAASERLGINCVWVEGEEWTEEIYGKPPPI
jgi:hypothetical protein